MTHIAFVNIPFAGHLNPTMAVVAELLARGHRVSYATTEAFAASIKGIGADPVVYETTLGLAQPARGSAAPVVESFADPARFSADDLARLIRRHLDEAVTVLPQLGRALAGDPPDVIVYDPACWTGRILAARWRLPAVRSQPVFVTNGQWSPAGVRAESAPAHPELSTLTRGVGKLLERAGADLTARELLVGDGTDPTIVYLPRAFQHAGQTFGGRYHFVGPCLGRPTSHRGWLPPGNGKPLVLVSLGTVLNQQPEFFQTCIRAFADESWHVVITLGDGLDLDAFSGIPANVEVYPYLPLPDVLAHADALICHAGMGSVMHGLHAGVPIVAVPYNAEDWATADRIVELGLGRQVAPEEVTAPHLRRVTAHVAGDRRIRARLRDMRGEIRAAGGAPAAADVIETALTPSTASKG